MERIDKYELIAEIARGGMGAVYKAVHPRFPTYPGVKEIRSDLTNSHSVQDRFRREADVLARLPAHPDLLRFSHIRAFVPRELITWKRDLLARFHARKRPFNKKPATRRVSRLRSPQGEGHE